MTNLEMYIIKLKADKKSEHTIIAYKKDIEQMLESVNKPEETVVLMDLIIWKESMSDMSSASVARKITSVKNYFEFLVDIEVLDKNIANKLKAPKINNKEKDYITKSEVIMMMDKTKSIKEKAIVATLLSTGLRISEFINLDLKDFDNEKLIVKTKGDKDRILFLNQDCRDIVNQYLKTRNSTITNLFVSNQGTPLKRECVSAMLKKLARKCGIDKDVSPHSLRHSHISAVANQYGVEVARTEIGHSSLSTTQRYCHTDEQVIKDVMQNFNL